MVGGSFNRQQFTLFCETNGAAGRSVLDRKNVNFQKRLSPIRQLFMCLASFAVGMRMLGIDKELFVKSMKWSQPKISSMLIVNMVAMCHF